jgi:hypothetical protein
MMMTRSLSPDIRGRVIAAISEGLSTRQAVASIFKVTGVREAIEKAGARLLFLPPDFNPIAELSFSMENSLKAEGAQKTVETTLENAHRALRAITEARFASLIVVRPIEQPRGDIKSTDQTARLRRRQFA